MELIIGRRATYEISQAFAHYEIEHPGLGEDFYRCLEAALALVQRAPRAQPFITATLGAFTCGGFPTLSSTSLRMNLWRSQRFFTAVAIHKSFSLAWKTKVLPELVV